MAVTLKGVHSCCGDFVVKRRVVEVFESLGILAFLIKADSEFCLRTVAALISGLCGIGVKSHSDRIVGGGIGLRHELVGLAASRLSHEQPYKHTRNHYDKAYGEACQSFLIGTCLGKNFLGVVELLGSCGIFFFHLFCWFLIYQVHSERPVSAFDLQK